MTFAPEERQILLTAYSMGPKMVDYLERAGIDLLSDLACSDARKLALRINAMLGRPHINAAGVAALENAIAVARRHTEEPGSGP